MPLMCYKVRRTLMKASKALQNKTFAMPLMDFSPRCFFPKAAKAPPAPAVYERFVKMIFSKGGDKIVAKLFFCCIIEMLYK